MWKMPLHRYLIRFFSLLVDLWICGLVDLWIGGLVWARTRERKCIQVRLINFFDQPAQLHFAPLSALQTFLSESAQQQHHRCWCSSAIALIVSFMQKLFQISSSQFYWRYVLHKPDHEAPPSLNLRFVSMFTIITTATISIVTILLLIELKRWLISGGLPTSPHCHTATGLPTSTPHCWLHNFNSAAHLAGKPHCSALNIDRHHTKLNCTPLTAHHCTVVAQFRVHWTSVHTCTPAQHIPCCKQWTTSASNFYWSIFHFIGLSTLPITLQRTAPLYCTTVPLAYIYTVYTTINLVLQWQKILVHLYRVIVHCIS